MKVMADLEDQVVSRQLLALLLLLLLTSEQEMYSLHFVQMMENGDEAILPDGCGSGRVALGRQGGGQEEGDREPES